MSASTTQHTLTLDAVDAEVLDAANWRPVTPQVAGETLGQMYLTVDEPTSLGATVEGLRDGRVRAIYHAYVKPCDFEGQGDGPGPYLMHLYSPEAGTSVWLVRQDVRLCDA